MNYQENVFIEKELKEPLTQEELASYFEKMMKGDQQAKDEIIIHNIRLVMNEVNGKFSNTPYEKQELIAVGLVGLVVGVTTYDIHREIRFSTYATVCIDNEILKYIKKEKKYINNDSLDRPAKYYTVPMGDTIQDDKADFMTDYEEQESYKVIRELVSKLSDRDGVIVKRYFGFSTDQPIKQEEIAKSLRISQSVVSRVIKKNIQQISLELQQKGLIEIPSKPKQKVKKIDK